MSHEHITMLKEKMRGTQSKDFFEVSVLSMTRYIFLPSLSCSKLANLGKSGMLMKLPFIILIKGNSSQSSDEEESGLSGSDSEMSRMRKEIEAKDRQINSLKRQVSNVKGKILSHMYFSKLILI